MHVSYAPRVRVRPVMNLRITRKRKTKTKTKSLRNRTGGSAPSIAGARWSESSRDARRRRRARESIARRVRSSLSPSLTLAGARAIERTRWTETARVEAVDDDARPRRRGARERRARCERARDGRRGAWRRRANAREERVGVGGSSDFVVKSRIARAFGRSNV